MSKYYIKCTVPHDHIQKILLDKGYTWAGISEITQANKDIYILVGDCSKENPKWLTYLISSDRTDADEWMATHRPKFIETTIDDLFPDKHVDKKEIEKFKKELNKKYG